MDQIIRICLLQLKSNETLFHRNKRIKVTALVSFFAQLCLPCSNDMHSIWLKSNLYLRYRIENGVNRGLILVRLKVNVLMKKVLEGGGNQTKISLIQKWRHGIDLMDWSTVNKRRCFKWFYFSMFAYILCNTNLTQYMVLCLQDNKSLLK